MPGVAVEATRPARVPLRQLQDGEIRIRVTPSTRGIRGHDGSVLSCALQSEPKVYTSYVVDRTDGH